MTDKNDEQKNDRIITCRDDIMKYLNLSKYMCIKFIKMGMPVLIIDGRWYAHKDNLDEFFRARTRVDSRNIPDNVLNSEEEK